jgi:hypothetical protein
LLGNRKAIGQIDSTYINLPQVSFCFSVEHFKISNVDFLIADNDQTLTIIVTGSG